MFPRQFLYKGPLKRPDQPRSLTRDFWECVPSNYTMGNVMKTAFFVENLPVSMKFAETVLMRGKRFVFHWKGEAPASGPEGNPPHKPPLKRPSRL